MIKTISTFLVTIEEKVDKINPFFLGVALFMIFLLLPLPIYNYGGIMGGDGDMAEYLNNPLRVINGELPYRDFWLLFPPGEVLLPAFIYKVFGLNINLLHVFSVIISAFIGIFSFLLGRLIFRDNFFATITAIIVFSNGITRWYLGYAYIHMYFLLLLISAFLFIKYLTNKGILELFLSGIFIGLAFLFRLYVVGAAFLAFFLIIFIHSKFDGKPFSYSIKSIVVFCSGVLLIISFASLALIEIWQPMIKEIAIESVLHGTSMKRPYFYSIGYFEYILTSLKVVLETGNILYVMKFGYHIVNFANITFFYLLPFLLVGISGWYLVGKKLKKSDKIVVLFFLFWGMFTFPKALGRSDISHLVYSITPLFFLLIFLLQKSIERFEINKKFLIKIIVYGFVIITLSLLTSAPLLFGYVLVKPHYKVSTKYGTLLFSNESEAKDANAVVDFIEKNTKEEDYIFVTPWYAPPFYALTNRKNPTYYDSLIDLIARPSDEKQIKVCNDLLDKDTKLIIHGSNWSIDNNQFLNTCHTLQRFIENNFELVEKHGRFWIYVPKSQKSVMKKKTIHYLKSYINE
jgi:hypothetical protein